MNVITGIQPLGGTLNISSYKRRNDVLRHGANFLLFVGVFYFQFVQFGSYLRLKFNRQFEYYILSGTKADGGIASRASYFQYFQKIGRRNNSAFHQHAQRMIFFL